ncbi:hypothetical protein ACFWMG_15535 [Streptomyces sp. NPDC127074]|uniref:hypothetical protein n=1 Tax=Streptomyces sp. NPDC127074 TaxID=3347130 RepID=UPI003669F4A0
MVPTTQMPMTVEQVFAGATFRTNEGGQGTEFFFRGHLTAGQVAEVYFATYPEHRSRYPYAVEPGSVRREWHLFTAHEDDCYLAEGDLDPILCTCAARAGLEGGSGYEYRHPHPATPGQPGAVAVTWAAIGPAGVPTLRSPDQTWKEAP